MSLNKYIVHENSQMRKRKYMRAGSLQTMVGKRGKICFTQNSDEDSCLQRYDTMSVGESFLHFRGFFFNDLLQRKYVQHVQDKKIVPLTNLNKYIHNE
jgi:hypothetical protein